MWTYFLGPVVALFPKPWRNALSTGAHINWAAATALSGSAEMLAGLVALMRWYQSAMSTWVGNGISEALSGKMGPEVRVQDIGGAALFVWVMHPLTWLFGYFVLEGALRLCAGAFARNSCGILPLFLVDKIVLGPFRRRDRSVGGAGAGVGANVTSYAGAIRDRVHAASHSEVPDELCFSQTKDGEILEVRASRAKQDWNPPRVVRYFDVYYRLEETARAGGERPYVYRLRRLPMGVPGRTVLMYAPSDAVVREVVR